MNFYAGFRIEARECYSRRASDTACTVPYSLCRSLRSYFSPSLPLHQILLSLPQLKKNVQKFFSYISSGFFIAYSKASIKAVVAARQADSVPASTAPLEFACDGGYQYLATRVLPAFNALSNA